MRHPAFSSYFLLGLVLALTACSTPPPPKPAPIVIPQPAPKPIENEVISLPERPIQALPSGW